MYYQSGNPKKLLVSSDAVWASRYHDAKFPDLYYSAQIPPSDNIQGSLEAIQVPNGDLVYKGEKETANNWKQFSEEELKKGPNGQLSPFHQRYAEVAAQGAFDNVDLAQLGYAELGAPQKEEDMTQVQKLLREAQINPRIESAMKGKTQVDSWIDGLRSREVKEGSSQSTGGQKSLETYTIAYSDVKQEPTKLFDSS